MTTIHDEMPFLNMTMSAGRLRLQQQQQQQQRGVMIGSSGIFVFVRSIFILMMIVATKNNAEAFTPSSPSYLSWHHSFHGHHHHHRSRLFMTTTSPSPSSSSLSLSSTIPTLTSAQLLPAQRKNEKLGPLASTLVKLGLVMFIASICVVLPTLLLPQAALFHMGLLSRKRKELWAWKTGQATCRWLVRLIPFCQVECLPAILPPQEEEQQMTNTDESTSTTSTSTSHDPQQQPCVWVCNHTSMLDVFILLAADAKLRGGGRKRSSSSSSSSSSLHRPIKIVYWKQLEDNFVTKLLFRQSGFLSVDMAANGHGQANEYDKRTFKTLLTQSKQALQQDKFDLGILPEGQLNPHTERGLLPIFPGAFTLAKLCHTPMGMMAVHGIDQLWHPVDGIVGRGRKVRVRCYPYVRPYTSADEFVQTFTHVVGHFGAVGHDVEDWQVWMKGTYWKQRQQQEQQEQEQADTAVGGTPVNANAVVITPVSSAASSPTTTTTTTTTTEKD